MDPKAKDYRAGMLKAAEIVKGMVPQPIVTREGWSKSGTLVGEYLMKAHDAILKEAYDKGGTQ